MRYEVATREEMEGLSGLDMLRAMIAGDLPAAPIAEALGFRLTEVEKGRALFEGVPGPHLFNPLGSVHGGYALTLIDSACGCAVHSELDAGIGYTTVETKVNFTRAIDPAGGPVACEGRVVSRGRQIATAEAYLRSAEGKLLAHGTSTLIILYPRS
ncbi:MAG TPA: PaaI family thioesterase [Allosphingosinicella sp.]|nr:PaaI family thioesterase [Allosphingosinicella sp.]